MSTPAHRRPAETVQHAHAAARQLIEAGRYEDAIAPLLGVARACPDDPGVLNDLGIAYMASRRFAEAIPWFRRSIASQPDVGSTHYNLGLALQHTGDDDAAIEAHRRAGTLSPSLAEAHGQLADLLWERGRRGEAIHEYGQAHASAPSTSLGRLSKAKALVADGRHSLAEGQLRLALAEQPSNGTAHALLGRILQETGRFGEAVASFERAIEIDPWNANAHQGLVSAKRVTEKDRPWVARLCSHLEDVRAPASAAAERQRMMLHFVAGKALDDLGSYEEAMQHFGAANAIRHRLSPLDRNVLERAVDQILARFTRDAFAGTAWRVSHDDTPLLVVGMPRSGTTLVERILASHPRARGRGELTFWPERGPAWMEAAPAAHPTLAGTLIADYLRELRGDDPAILRAVDKMPFNFLWVGLVHSLFPRARIVHCQRDPIDTCLSIYTTPFPASWGFTSTMSDLAWYYRLYLRVVEHWRSVLPPETFLDVRYEDVVAQPEAAARRLVGFAGLSWDAACLTPEANRDVIATASSWQARQPINGRSVGRARRYEPWLGELRELANGR